MPDPMTTTPRRTSVKRLKLVTATALLAAGGLYLLAAVLVATPWAADAVSRTLSAQLHQHVTVGTLRLRGFSLECRGLAILPEPAAGSSPLLSVRSLLISPDWLALARGRRSFREISLDAPSVTIFRTRTGDWNFAGLLQGRRGAKKAAAPVTVGRLAVNAGTVTVNGYTVKDLGITLHDLSTAGTTAAGLRISGQDPAGNRFTATGTSHAGASPEMEIRLSAPRLALAMVRPRPAAADLSRGICSIDLTAGLHNRLLSLHGTAGVDGIALLQRDSRIPLKLALDLLGSYRWDGDAASLDRLSLTLNDTVGIRASGTMREVRKRGMFNVALATSAVDLARLSRMLPPEMRRVTLTGRLAPATLHLSGSRREGIATGRGELTLAGGTLLRDAVPLAREIEAHAALEKIDGGWKMAGHLHLRSPQLQELDAELAARFSERFRLVSAEAPRLHASYSGLPLTGDARYAPEATPSLSARLELPAAPLATLNGIAGGHGVKLASGTVGASATVTGVSLSDLQAVTHAVVQNARGEAAGKPFRCRKTEVRGTVRRTTGSLTAAARLELAEADYGGHRLDGALSAALAGDGLSLSGGSFRYDDVRFTLPLLRATLPRRTVSAAGTSLPLRFSFGDLSASTGTVSLRGVSGRVDAILNRRDDTSWLDGTAALQITGGTFRGSTIGPANSSLRFSRQEAVATLAGSLGSGTVTATARHDLSPARSGTSYTAALHAIPAGTLQELAGRNLPVRIGTGTIDAELAGNYTPAAGPDCRFAATAAELSLTGQNGRTLIRDGGLNLSGRWSGGSLSLSDGRMTAGKEISLSLSGRLDRAASPDRTGSFRIVLPATPVASVVDAAVGLLPRALQEASVAGTAGLEATVRIAGPRTILDGRLGVSDGGLEIPSQKLAVTGMGGSLPFSLSLSGTAPSRPRIAMVGRKEFAAAADNLRRHRTEDAVFKVGGIRFGALELGPVELYSRAADGLTEFSSLRIASYNGTLLGTGFFLYEKGPVYGGTILMDSVSLRAFCDAYPTIKGYISGKLNGSLTVAGAGSGIDRLGGRLDLWTHAARDEKMLVSKEFLQKLAGRKLKGLFFRTDRSYDHGVITADLQDGYLTFETLDISHTNFLGMRDLSVTVAPVQNRIALDHLFTAIKQAAERGKKATGEMGGGQPPPATDTEFKWEQ